MSDPIGIPESTSIGTSLFKSADLPGGLYSLSTMTKNNKGTPPTINKPITLNTTVTVKQLLSIFTQDFDSTQLPAPNPGMMKIGKVSNGFVLQDAQVNDKGELQYTFLNSGVGGV